MDFSFVGPKMSLWLYVSTSISLLAPSILFYNAQLLRVSILPVEDGRFIWGKPKMLTATAISAGKYWIPFDLQSQAGKSRLNTTVREYVGIGRCRSFLHFFPITNNTNSFWCIALFFVTIQIDTTGHIRDEIDLQVAIDFCAVPALWFSSRSRRSVHATKTTLPTKLPSSRQGCQRSSSKL